MAVEPQVETAAVSEFLLRFQAARAHGRATYLECVEYTLNVMLPRCMCEHVDGSDEFCVSLPAYGNARTCVLELKLMLTLLLGLRRHSIAHVIERKKIPSLLGTLRTWRLRVNVPKFNSTGDLVCGNHGG